MTALPALAPAPAAPPRSADRSARADDATGLPGFADHLDRAPQDEGAPRPVRYDRYRWAPAERTAGKHAERSARRTGEARRDPHRADRPAGEGNDGHDETRAPESDA
ncbi:MAG: hypothetical protein ACTHQ3_02930, partial [Motilibacteraceae bacterium]